VITYKELKKNEDVRTYITAADATLGALGFTEHGLGHVTKVAECVKYILETLGHTPHEVELGQIAALLHDIGNLVNRRDHAYTGAVMAFRLLDKLGFSAADTSLVVSAIGNHDETGGLPVNAVAAALILADKSDVRRSRVRHIEDVKIDIHDRVNYAVTSSSLTIDDLHSQITLELEIDTKISSVMEYFEIFLERMLLCKKAASALGLEFNLVMNRQEIL
jgi:metal-dependent HD superfamily phosphatase/phosphodiesterase